ncbi:MAG: hypothetical protein RMJ04_03440 [Geminicoccaceae bacterium]|nr:hypothetical protein [Geminicoccaceae bacterium]
MLALAFGPGAAHEAEAGRVRELARETVPLVLKDGRIARVGIWAIPFRPGANELEAEVKDELARLLESVATDCFLTAQVIGHVEPEAARSGEPLAAHRLARARADRIHKALVERGLQATAVAAVWDWQFVVKEPRVTLWVFRLQPGEDCRDQRIESAPAAARPPGTAAPEVAAGAGRTPSAPNGERAGTGAGPAPPARPASPGPRAPEVSRPVPGKPPEPGRGAASGSLFPLDAPPPVEPRAPPLAGTAPPPKPAILARSPRPAAAASAPSARPAAETIPPIATPSSPEALAVPGGAPPRARSAGAEPRSDPAASEGSDASAAVAAGEAKAGAPAGAGAASAAAAPAVGSQDRARAVRGEAAASLKPASPEGGRGADRSASALPLSLEIRFEPNSSFFPEGAVQKLRAFLAALPEKGTIELALEAAAGGPEVEGPGAGDRSARWLAERRLARLVRWLEENAGKRDLRFTTRYRDGDPSRRVILYLRSKS